LRQIANVTDGERLAATARKASEALVRGIVAASSGAPTLVDNAVEDGPQV
jgi:hypothetical protein